jgi:hypothetical protein
MLRPIPALSRRSFLRGGTAGFALAAAAAGLTAPASANSDTPAQGNARQRATYELRRDAAHAYVAQNAAVVVANGDEDRYADKRASFAKTLLHNDLGEPDALNFQQLLDTLAGADSDAFAQLPRSPEAQVKLNNPQAAFAFELAGLDGHATHTAPPPVFASRDQARDTAEVYWQSLTLDVPFREYDSDPLCAAAVADLNALSDLNDPLTLASLFRGATPGDLQGPYISQFLWLSVPYGIHSIDQRYRFPLRGQAFLTSYDAWLACQRGSKPKDSLQFDATMRYISSNRELAEYVHQDFSFAPYLNAALVMLRFGDDALSPTNPYRGLANQSGDITFGNKNILSLIAEAALLGQKGSWYHKWLVHRRARPEVVGGRLQNHFAGKAAYDLHADLLQCDAIARVRQANWTALLPVAFPEGSPTHPSYPSAHAANAGACITILKAFFNADFVIPDPVQATNDGSSLEPWTGADLTLGGEIEKLASNIAMGRDSAGVHFRTDSIQGLRVGESQAIGLLCDYSRTYNERFDGFRLTTLDGRSLVISNGVAVG